VNWSKNYQGNNIFTYYMHKTMNWFTKGLMLSIVAIPQFFGMVASAAAPDWNVAGTYVVNFNNLGTDFPHDMTLAQDTHGNVTGNGGSPVGGAHTYMWAITSGSVSGNILTFRAQYSAPADALSPLTVMYATATIAANGSFSGTWSDNYQGIARSGTWSSASGTATTLPGVLAAEDFGVVNYATGNGTLRGYTAGFGLTGATFTNVQSVVMKLYAGATLLQTNTSKAKVTTDITGAQISSPFDVSGTFNYGADGYWTNTRESQYGQSASATRVVATVVLASGKTVTAENTNLTGIPSTIYPVVTTPVPTTTATSTKPTSKSQCKNGGWTAFTSPQFANQGACIAYVNSVNNHATSTDAMHGHHGKDRGHGDDHGRGHGKGKKSAQFGEWHGKSKGQSEHGSRGHRD
jgi:hypothetical protein